MFLRVNGWPIPVRDRSTRERFESVGALGPSFLGKPMRAWRARPQTLTLQAPALERADADTLEGLLDGRGHHFPLDFDAWSESGVGPEAPAGSAWSIVPRLPGTSGVFGAGYLNVGTSILWNPQIGPAWTVLYWRNASLVSSAQQVAVRADGAKFASGVRNDALSTPELVVGSGAVGLLTGTYDDVVILGFNASDAFIAAFMRWSAAMGLSFFADFVDGTGRNILSDASGATPTPTGGSLLRSGGKIGGCWLSTAVTHHLVYGAAQAPVHGLPELTVEAWVLPTDPYATGAIVSDLAASAGYELRLNEQVSVARPGLKANLYTAGGQATAVAAVDPLQSLLLGVHNHVAMRWRQATGGIDLFLNGQPLVLDGTQASFPGSAAVDDSANSLYVCGSAASGSAGYAGRTSEVRVYGAALSNAEIRERYLAGVDGARGVRPHPFSALPALRIDGEANGARSSVMLGRVTNETVVQHGQHTTPGWHNDSRDVEFDLDQVADDPAEVLPSPLWSFGLDENYVQGTLLLPSTRGTPVAVVSGTPSFVTGPFCRGRARVFAGAGYYRLDAQHAEVLGGQSGATLLAWVRKRSSSGAEAGIAYLGNASLSAKLSIGFDGTNHLLMRGRPVTGGVLVTQTAAAPLTDTASFHLVGCAFDPVDGYTWLFADDAGLATTPSGFYTRLANPAGGVKFSADGYTDSALGVGAAAFSAPWFGDIAFVALYAGVLSAVDVNRIWRAGRRGVLR